jgi:multidrug efflux pump subunit AcrA (membrane-fusion protein)
MTSTIDYSTMSERNLQEALSGANATLQAIDADIGLSIEQLTGREQSITEQQQLYTEAHEDYQSAAEAAVPDLSDVDEESAPASPAKEVKIEAAEADAQQPPSPQSTSSGSSSDFVAQATTNLAQRPRMHIPPRALGVSFGGGARARAC